MFVVGGGPVLYATWLTALGASAAALEGPSVRHLSRVNTQCVAGSTAGLFHSADDSILAVEYSAL